MSDNVHMGEVHSQMPISNAHAKWLSVCLQTKWL